MENQREVEWRDRISHFYCQTLKINFFNKWINNNTQFYNKTDIKYMIHLKKLIVNKKKIKVHLQVNVFTISDF